MRTRTHGYTLVEILIVIVVLAIMFTILAVGYGTWKRSSAVASVKSDVTQAAVGLRNYQNFNNGYPPNLAGINYSGSEGVALALWTNAPGTPVYENLNNDENVQLLLFACNAFMPIEDGGTTYNTACTTAGQNIHVSGEKSTNIVFKGPTVELSDFNLTCGAVCDDIQSQILTIFEAQGGTWPLHVTGDSVSLPDPTNFNPTSNATRYCLQGTSATFSDIMFHVTNADNYLQPGPCPEDAELHYP